ncbi:hypothetical protein DSM03_10778 [Leeuwenhoekiella aestuarii]|uniref:Uncharacterized protein n=2 Tax=Leeuwenhoekiella aestuarii TaxID=2249426 RepID=A0A4Q0NP79_9FLAO|nr:hypothetical protein DSM04_10878 [Leeuwenhoekiella aestuarii]RXG13539.1 hypothetical protein DSM03_10778 [Leeuwenhoekiella aestuarii]
MIYRPLFKIDIYHHYFLDDGTVSFDENSILKQKQLAKYNWQTFGHVKPTK